MISTPAGIRFDCTGCGNCCFAWPVPLTAGDVTRLTLLCKEDETLPARRLPGGEGNFTHTLEKRDDGYCTYLTQDKRCRLHAEFGFASKPAMCQVFPWSFNELPSGVFAYVSFASTGVLFNQGRLLSEQPDVLAQMYEVHKALFPRSTDWSRLQSLDGVPLSFDDFLRLEKDIIDPGSQSKDAVPRQLLGKLNTSINLVRKSVPAPRTALPKLEARAKIVDLLLLKHIDSLLLPDDVYGTTNFDLDARTLMTEIISAPNAVSLHGTRTADLIKFELKQTEAEFDELLDRFIYCRIFAKLYFGPGFHHLSLLVGLRFMAFVYVALKVRLKIMLLSNPQATIDQKFELVRVVERRLTQLRLSGPTLAVLEVLLADPERVERISSLVS